MADTPKKDEAKEKLTPRQAHAKSAKERAEKREEDLKAAHSDLNEKRQKAGKKAAAPAKKTGKFALKAVGSAGESLKKAGDALRASNPAEVAVHLLVLAIKLIAAAVSAIGATGLALGAGAWYQKQARDLYKQHRQLEETKKYEDRFDEADNPAPEEDADEDADEDEDEDLEATNETDPHEAAILSTYENHLQSLEDLSESVSPDEIQTNPDLQESFQNLKKFREENGEHFPNLKSGPLDDRFQKLQDKFENANDNPEKGADAKADENLEASGDVEGQRQGQKRQRQDHDAAEPEPSRKEARLFANNKEALLSSYEKGLQNFENIAAEKPADAIQSSYYQNQFQKFKELRKGAAEHLPELNSGPLNDRFQKLQEKFENANDNPDAKKGAAQAAGEYDSTQLNPPKGLDADASNYQELVQAQESLAINLENDLSKEAPSIENPALRSMYEKHLQNTYQESQKGYKQLQTIREKLGEDHPAVKEVDDQFKNIDDTHKRIQEKFENANDNPEKEAEANAEADEDVDEDEEFEATNTEEEGQDHNTRPEPSTTSSTYDDQQHYDSTQLVKATDGFSEEEVEGSSYPAGDPNKTAETKAGYMAGNDNKHAQGQANVFAIDTGDSEGEEQHTSGETDELVPEQLTGPSHKESPQESSAPTPTNGPS